LNQSLRLISVYEERELHVDVEAILLIAYMFSGSLEKLGVPLSRMLMVDLRVQID
jgi:hypothetical protein